MDRFGAVGDDDILKGAADIEGKGGRRVEQLSGGRERPRRDLEERSGRRAAPRHLPLK